MNKQETHEAILVMKAYCDGAEIVFANVGEDIWAKKTASIMWDFVHYQYRIKPEVKLPLEVFLHINRKTGKVVGWNHKSETMHQDPKIIHTLFREVLE